MQNALIGRSIWGQAKKEFQSVEDMKIKDQMSKDFVNYYGKNIINESTLIRWCSGIFEMV